MPGDGTTTDPVTTPAPSGAAAAATGAGGAAKALPGRLVALGVCLAFVAAVAPTLHRLEFFDGVEHFNLVTVQEMRRDEAGGKPVNWLMPTLEGEPRVVKPPLTAWVTAAFVSADTVRGLSVQDPTARGAAFERFVRAARWPSLLCAALMLMAVYELGRAVGAADGRPGWAVGVVAVVVCASCLLMLRQGRRATTDLQLALWVTVANALLAKALLERRYRLGFVGAGVALGLAQMAKGPHIPLLLSAAPAVVFALWRRRGGGAPARVGEVPGAPRRRFGLPLAAGVVLSTALGLWWYGYVLRAVPGVMDVWFHEVTRIDATTARNRLKPDPWYEYASLLRWMLPWTAWFLLGAAVAGRVLLLRLPLPGRLRALLVRTETGAHQGPRDGNPGAAPPAHGSVFALLLLLVPLVVMSFWGEKKERYLLPFAPPAAVLAAVAIVPFLRSVRRQGGGLVARRIPRIRLGAIAAAVTWVAAAWLAVGVPVAGAMGLKDFRTWDGQPWFSRGTAAVAACGGAALLAGGALLFRRSRVPAVVAVVLATWLGHEMLLRGQLTSPGDPDDRPQRQLADRIWREYPDAVLYSADPPTLYGQLSRPTVVVSLYADRVVRARPDPLPSVPGERPLVLLTDVQGEEPPAPPAPWERLDVLPLRRGQRYVYVLPPRAP